MEDNNQQIEICILHEETKKLVELTTPKEIDSVETSIQEKVGSLDSSKSKCCIYKVPEFMQKDKQDCYRPLVISIGPVFCKDVKLQTMQELKWIYMDSFLRHPDNACGSLDSYISKVRELNAKIRGCYQEQGMIACENDDEFIEVIVFDAVFLVYLIKHRRNTYHPIPQKLHTLMSFLERDLFLEENQVPYFVLQHIFDLAFPTTQGTQTTSFTEYTRRFVGSCNILGSKHVASITDIIDEDASNFEHLLDFWRNCSCSSLDTRPNIYQTPHHHFPMTAKQLSDAGVKFKENESENPLNIWFNERKGELHIPKLTVDDDTEAILRSILFFEQSHYICKGHSYFIDMLVFFDALIDSVEDIHILQREEILDLHLGSDEVATKIFNKITKYMTFSPIGFYHSDASKKANLYANRFWNRSMATLRRDYFSHPWAIISVIVAFMLFVLTVLQTVTGFIKD